MIKRIRSFALSLIDLHFIKLQLIPLLLQLAKSTHPVQFSKREIKNKKEHFDIKKRVLRVQLLQLHFARLIRKEFRLLFELNFFVNEEI